MMVFGTRKFAGLLQKDRSSSHDEFREFYACLCDLRDLKNAIIPRIMSCTTSANFQKSGNIAAKQLYNRIRKQVFAHLLPHFVRFKERVLRNTFFEVYDTLRNQWVRNGWLVQIIHFLQTQPNYVQIQFLQQKIPRELTYQILRSLRHCFSGKPAGFSEGYLNNLLGELRQRVITGPQFRKPLWDMLVHFKQDQSAFQMREKAMLKGWIRHRKKKTVELIPKQILPSLFQSYKRSSTRILNKICDLWKSQPEQALLKAQTLLNTKDDKTSTDLTVLRTRRLTEISIDHIDLSSLIGDALQHEIAAVTMDNYLRCIFQPSYSKMRVQSIDATGLEDYIAQQLQRHARHIFAGSGPNSLLGYFIHHGGTAGDVLSHIFTDLVSTLETNIQTPIVHSLTWCLKFKEQLHALKLDGTDGYKSSLSLLLTPYLRHQGFRFNVPSKTIQRLRKAGGELTPLDQLFSAPPVIQLEGRKVIFNQPLQMVPQNPFPPSSARLKNDKYRVMGVDLGVKHFAVLSIFEYDRLTQAKQEIGRFFLDQKKVLACQFNTTTLRFDAPYRTDYNVKRRLEHLRQEQRKLSHIICQMESDGGNHRTRQFYYRQKRHTNVWRKVQRIHAALTQKIAHLLSNIAKAFGVDQIVFEDLRWSQHSSRREVGRWLSHNQQHFFHSQIIDRVQFMASYQGFTVKRHNARWSSQICWRCQLLHNLHITPVTSRSSIQSYLGHRSSKNFRFSSENPQEMWRGDSDLNAARNMALRALVAA